MACKSDISEVGRDAARDAELHDAHGLTAEAVNLARRFERTAPQRAAFAQKARRRTVAKG
jgi:hypothetical protein